jgi:hypothetical protein
MAIATFDQLRSASPMGESLRLDDVRKSLTSKNLFLSHSLSDLSPAKAAVNMLEKHGADVYLDIEDVSLKGVASKDIATRLRNAIRHCKRLVVIVTENTQTSRWIPWEMGIADVEFGESRVALLPAKASASASEMWVQQEYFDLYARIEPVASSPSATPTWLVRTSDGNWISLNDWLSRTKPPRY